MEQQINNRLFTDQLNQQLEQILNLEYCLVRVESGYDVIVILDVLRDNLLQGDLGELIDMFAIKQLYVIKAKYNKQLNHLTQNPVFIPGLKLTIPITYYNNQGEHSWAVSSTFKQKYPLLYKQLQEKYNITDF